MSFIKISKRFKFKLKKKKKNPNFFLIFKNKNA